ncbi:secreted protein [gut metagenome]|uniref:Secreted protein n=1 Tax=gut metagenome TaxID=749906 RepID=J9CHD5_9ZZZZ
METPSNLKLNHKLGGVSSISGTLSSVSGAFPTFAVQSIVFPL